ncbi:hypothetical protein [Companilactobacillus suantsaicola]|uniref:hypothetical protein n=1 Tax=Companilactobacillus suantsaicola TaxID=2487723 RepID=UPI00143681AF|nr:hypothetical protein [Companilactobacillus suantsaicola]
MNGFDDWLQDEPQESQEVNEVGDCEAYDVMIDDKLTEDKRNERAKNEKYFRNN